MINNFDNSDFSLINETNLITGKLVMLIEKMKEIKEEQYKEKESNIILNQQYKKLEEKKQNIKNKYQKRKRKKKKKM